MDGLRLDTFPYVDRSYWQDFHSDLHALYPNLTTVAEIYNSDPTVTSYFAGGQKHVGIDTGVDTEFDFPSYFALRSTLTSAPSAPSHPWQTWKMFSARTGSILIPTRW